MLITKVFERIPLFVSGFEWTTSVISFGSNCISGEWWESKKVKTSSNSSMLTMMNPFDLASLTAVPDVAIDSAPIAKCVTFFFFWKKKEFYSW